MRWSTASQLACNKERLRRARTGCVWAYQHEGLHLQSVGNFVDPLLQLLIRHGSYPVFSQHSTSVSFLGTTFRAWRCLVSQSQRQWRWVLGNPGTHTPVSHLCRLCESNFAALVVSPLWSITTVRGLFAGSLLASPAPLLAKPTDGSKSTAVQLQSTSALALGCRLPLPCHRKLGG